MNAISWFEIPVTDLGRAREFYERIIDAELTLDTSFPGMPLALFPYTQPGVGGCLLASQEVRPHSDGVRVYLNGGSDLGKILDRVVSAGGQIVMPKTHLRDDIGHIGMFSDSEGNVIGLHSMS